jgi:hypothetical protein
MKEFMNGTITGREFRDNFFLLMKNLNAITYKFILDSEKFQDFNPDFL